MAKRTVDEFTFGDELGEGSYSTVVKATDKTNGRLFAAKILQKKHIIKNNKVKYVNSEKDVLHRTSHPFIIRLWYTFQDANSLYFMLDLAPNGDLLSMILKAGKLPLAQTRFYMAELVAATQYLHSVHVIHRDLKPENILLDDKWHIKVTDFGSAALSTTTSEADNPRKSSFVGTAEYVSPELLGDKVAGTGVDLWALGCILFYCLEGRTPFKAGNEYQVFQRILKLQYEFTPESSIDADAKDIIQKLLVLDPTQRLGYCESVGQRSTSSSSSLTLRDHPFFKGIDWNTLPQQTPPALS